jgi:hypothetical protein
VASLPRWYAFLADRRIHSGDQMFYRIRGVTLPGPDSIPPPAGSPRAGAPFPPRTRSP